MTLLEKLEEAKTSLVSVKAAVEAGEKTADDLQEAITKVKDIQGQIDAANDAEALLKGLETPKAEKADKEEEEKMEYKTIGEQVAAKAAEAKDHVKEQNYHVIVPGLKAAAVMGTPSSISPAVTDVDTRIVEGYRRPLLIADLFGAESISGSALTYFVESATVEGGPAHTTEGSEKPMMSFGDPTAVTVALKKIASYMKETDELVADAPWLASSINGRGMYQHELAVENYLITTLAGTSGIGTASLLTPDGIFKAMMTVQNNSGFAADAIVINPTDYQNIRLRKDNNGQYFGGGFMSGAYGNGGIVEQPPIWGLRTVVTSAVAAGTCYVGAFKLGGSIVRKNAGVAVDIAYQNEDDFIKNLVTVRIEERLALAVRRPAAFVKITGSSTSTEA
jgi:HK97 family phage major capsid protein